MDTRKDGLCNCNPCTCTNCACRGPASAGRPATTRHLMLGTGLMALVTPVLYLYLLVAAPGPASAAIAAVPMTPALMLAAVASFLLGWLTIATLSFPQSPDAPGPDTSNSEGGIPIMRRQVRLRWAESANPAA